MSITTCTRTIIFLASLFLHTLTHPLDPPPFPYRPQLHARPFTPPSHPHGNVLLSPYAHHASIVGGSAYTASQWGDRAPNFFARISIHVGPFYDNAASCGGTVISPTIIVTAAHCVRFPNPVRYLPLPFLFVPQPFISVHVGSTDTRAAGTPVSVRDILLPAAYERGDPGADIAVVRLRSPVPSHAYEPVRARGAADGAPAAGAQALTVGMGLHDDAMRVWQVRELRIARVAILPARRCGRGGLCARTLSETSGGLCRHDSGSPLLLVEHGRFVLVGVSRAAAPVACLPVMKTHYYTPVWPFWQDLAELDAGIVPDGWVGYTHGVRITWRHENVGAS